MTVDSIDGILSIDKLKHHYKHCIRLSASNKINPKNAFDLQLIDYMQDLVSCEDGQMNFKIASSALDVGAKIYSNRVDCIQSEAQKVASSILMALEAQQGKSTSNNTEAPDQDTSATSDRLDDSRGEIGEDGNQVKNGKKKRAHRNKNVKTVVEDENLLNGKIEKMVLGDPFLDGLSEDYDMSCPAALICYNSLTQPNCLLTIESSHLRKDYRDPLMTNASVSNSSENNNFVTLITKSVNCAQIIRNNQTNRICPRLENFLFNDRTTAISGSNCSILDESSIHMEHVQNINTVVGGAHEFNPELYEGANNDDYGDDHIGDAYSEAGDENQPADDLIPNLDQIAATKPTEYGYSTQHHRLLNTWAGPHAWKALKAPMTSKKDMPPKSARKRTKLEQKPINFAEKFDSKLETIAKKDIRHSSEVIRKWKRPLLPQDHNLNEEIVRATLVHTFMRPEDTYHCTKTPADASKIVDIDHDYSKNGRNTDDGDASTPVMGGFDDVHDDSDDDDEFRADPVVEGNNVPVFGNGINATLTQQADFEFAGENLIEQPYTVAQVNIPFAKVAKKMDVRKLKRVMWDLLIPPESSACENSIESPLFSNIYGEVPAKVSTKMANDLSKPIAFVTLLHLANEKNLKLLPQSDLKDFNIEQD